MSETPAKPPRFPYIAALFCAGCLGAAAWTWMRYSYAWDSTADEMGRRCMAIVQSEWARADTQGRCFNTMQDWSRFAVLPRPYVAVRGKITDSVVGPDGRMDGSFGPHRDALVVLLPAGSARPDSGVEQTYVGRLRCWEGSRSSSWSWPLHARDPSARKRHMRTFAYDTPVSFFYGLDATASRFTGASVAGLVVGAVGVFVFTVALRHWLGERRKFREEARA